jgi:GT2 family glycosyltransferase
VRDALERRDLPATVEHAEVAHSYRVQPVLSELPLVSIIIPTRDALELVSVCIDSLLSKTNYGHFEVIVVDNGTTDSAALGYLDGVRRVERVRVLRDDRPFNFSALNNRAVEQASGRVLCLLNNDIEIIEPGWLTQLVAHAVRPDVGCVGAKLLFPDDTIQHAGVLLGLHGLAGHPYRRMSARHPGYYGRLTVTHGISAVTAACLVVERDIYRKLGGFDEQLAVAFNDVDFCIKVREAGYRNVMVPTVALVHHESATRGLDQARLKRQRFMREVERMKERWGGLLYDDPHYSPHLSLEHDDYSLRIAK